MISGLTQRFVGGSGYDLQRKLEDICTILIRAVTVDLPAIIGGRLQVQDGVTVRQLMELSRDITRFNNDLLAPHAEAVLALERSAAQWKAPGPQSLYGELRQTTSDFSFSCATLALDVAGQSSWANLSWLRSENEANF